MKHTKKYFAVLVTIGILLCSIIAITSFAANSSQGDNEAEIEELQPMVASRCSSFPSYPGDNPNVAPGDGWEWRGPALLGSWYNPTTTETLHPHLDSSDHSPHWDYIPYKNGPQYRIYPDGRVELK